MLYYMLNAYGPLALIFMLFNNNVLDITGRK